MNRLATSGLHIILYNIALTFPKSLGFSEERASGNQCVQLTRESRLAHFIQNNTMHFAVQYTLN